MVIVFSAKETNKPVIDEKVILAKSTSIDEKTLLELSNDEKIEIRRTIAQNPNITEEIMDKLSDEEDGYILENILNNKNTPSNILMKIFLICKKNMYTNLIHKIIFHPNVTKEILFEIYKINDICVKESLAKTEKTPVVILDKLSFEKEKSIRFFVARNPNTHIETLKRLENSSKDISNASKRNLKNREKQF